MAYSNYSDKTTEELLPYIAQLERLVAETDMARSSNPILHYFIAKKPDFLELDKKVEFLSNCKING